MLPPAGRFTLSLILPEPLAVHVPPPAPTQVQVAAVIAGGKVSVNAAPVALLGPALLTVMVYVVLVPGTYAVTPSVFVTDRSA